MTRQEYKDIYEVVGAAIEVHKTLGRGMAEAIYQEALAVEMKKRGLIVEREKELRLSYKDVLLEGLLCRYVLSGHHHRIEVG